MTTATTPQQLPDWLGRRATVNADSVAIETPTQRLTYEQLRSRATAAAGVLRGTGVQSGDRVALVARDAVSFTVALHAIMQCDAVLVPVNWRLAASEIQWQLHDAGVKVIVYDNRQATFAAEIHGGLENNPELLNIDGRLPSFPPVARSYVQLSDVQAIIYTSGTTGHPKGTKITYGNHWWSATSSAIQLGLSTAERWLAPMPLFHVGGLGVLMRSLIYGTTAVIHDKFDADAVNRAIDREQITLVSVVPAMLQRMLEHRTTAYPATLRCVLLGGSGAPRPLLEKCQGLSVPVAQSYGLTESNTQAATLSPEDGLRKLGSSGRPLLPTEIAIYVDGRPVGPNVEGEIAIKGPTVTPGYYNRPDATERAFQDGWLLTGDIGYLDDEGYLYVMDRRNDLIVSGGENVYPAEVESVLHAHPAVAEAAVVAKQDDKWGQVPVAFIKGRAGVAAETDDLVAFCRERLAGYKVPKEINWVEELPRNASGKLLRRKLREWLNR